jgi:branched-chain amino acid transport system permease protein
MATQLPPADHVLRPRHPAWVVNNSLVLLVAALYPLQLLLNSQMDPYFLRIVILIGINIILAVSLNLINGITGQFSLGHAGFMAIGAYVAGSAMDYFRPEGMNAELAIFGLLLAGGALAALAGLLVGIPSLRLRGDYLAIATLAFGEIIRVLINATETIGPFKIGSASGLHSIPGPTGLFWVYAWVVACIVCVWRLAYSTKGLAFRAVREDEIAAGAMGINTTFHKVAAFAVGAFFAGVAGGLYATYQRNLDPTDFQFMRSVEIVVMVVLGGSGSISGAILAAIILTWLPEQLREFKDWRMIVYSLLLIGMMIVRPGGLLGSRELFWPRRTAGAGRGFLVVNPPKD